MNIIAVANQTGGCGKTTTAINLAAELGRLGERVLLIDMDPQAHATLGMGITGHKLRNLGEVFCDNARLPDVVVPRVSDNVDLVPASMTLAGVGSRLAGRPARERKLLEQIEALDEDYDDILIDCPAALGFLSINALRAACQVIAPTEPGSLDGVEQLQDIVNRLCQKYGLQLPVTVVPVMLDGSARGSDGAIEGFRRRTLNLSDVAIRHTLCVREAAYLGKPLHRYAPDCAAAQDYRRLARQLLGARRQASSATHCETTREDPCMAQANAKPSRRMIVLTFDDIDCRRLQLAGDFNDWIPDRDVETRRINGSWQKVFTAEPGIYEYRLIIDGVWQHDPTNPAEIPNEIGGVNSILQVPVHH